MLREEQSVLRGWGGLGTQRWLVRVENAETERLHAMVYNPMVSLLARPFAQRSAK